MLRSIQVRHFATVDDITLEFDAGMTVLTGETGAGKSLLVDALNLAVGERANVDVIRSGTTSAEVNALFDPPPAACEWLELRELTEDDGACMLRRVIARDGRSRAYINARPVPVSHLKQLGQLLLDVHGQHAHQSLLSANAQRQAIDDFGDYDDAITRVREAFDAVRIAQSQVAARENERLAHERAEFLRFQLGELNAQLDITPQPSAVVSEHQRLAHAGETLQRVELARELLGEDGAEQQISQALRAVDDALRYDTQLQSVRDLILDSQSLLHEAHHQLTRRVDAAQNDPIRLDELDRALAALQDLARKHRTSIEQLPTKRDQLLVELEQIEQTRNDLADADAKLEAARAAYFSAAEDLSRRRRKVVKPFEAAIRANLTELGMQSTTVVFELNDNTTEELSRQGVDKVSLKVATHPSQPPMPIARVASGGELSRIALAIQTATSAHASVPTVIFDEVDSGVGGAVAEILGRRMRALAINRQVLAVTHLAQVAAQAHAHVRVVKEHDEATQRTRVETLNNAARVNEVARMIGGIDVTRQTLAHAREMLKRARHAGDAVPC